MASEIEAFQKIAIYSVPALLGIILHEVAHGFCAYRLGDPTARDAGRLTVNPLPHIDPMGLLVFVVTTLSGALVFGWAKPVPIDTRYFRNPRRDFMLVALAGPCTNFLLAAFFAFLLWAGLFFVPESFWLSNSWAISLLLLCKAGVFINLGLAWLNLVPLPPLDGSRVVLYLLPPKLAAGYAKLERYGLVILILLLVTGALHIVLVPLMDVSSRILLAPLHN
ncbi:MAG: site-2 protease family protein [Desulfovibrionaceae bacterium]|nr:site-2 protease family protein [Desulfovibrionaceae bacterium]